MSNKKILNENTECVKLTLHDTFTTYSHTFQHAKMVPGRAVLPARGQQTKKHDGLFFFWRYGSLEKT